MSTFITDFSKHIGEEVTVQGWLYNKRSSGPLYFLEIRDGQGWTQAVAAKAGLSSEIWKAIDDAGQESSIKVVGKVAAHPKRPGVFELHVTGFETIQNAVEYPIALKDHGPDFLLEHRHLWLRSKRQWAILRIRDAIKTAIHNYLHEQKFISVDSPEFTPNACEGTTTLFAVPYFDLGEAYLSQSGQLYIEAAIASVGRCYDFGPVFRAEKSKTKRHLTEFWMMDAEAAFVEHDENLSIQEGLARYVIRYCLDHCQEEFAVLERNVETLKAADAPFTRYTYDQAIVKLHELGSDIKYGEDLGNDDEGLLTKDSPVPIFIEKWPAAIKSFYMKRVKENPDLVYGADLIATEGGGEIAGGSQREENIEILLERIKAEGLNQADYEWYLDTRRFGSIPHSGFGFGLERLVRWISGTEHIRECIPFPRTIGRLRP